MVGGKAGSYERDDREGRIEGRREKVSEGRNWNWKDVWFGDSSHPRVGTADVDVDVDVDTILAVFMIGEIEKGKERKGILHSLWALVGRF